MTTIDDVVTLAKEVGAMSEKERQARERLAPLLDTQFEHQTFLALQSAHRLGLSKEDLNILCYHCGISASDIREAK